MEDELRNDFYVYIHKRKDTNEVFYVGKGTRNRFKTSSRHNKLWHKIREDAGGFIAEIIHSNLTEQEALQKEREYILNPPVGFNLINKSWTEPTIKLDLEEMPKCFYYDETSPSCLRYIVNDESLAIQKRRGKRDKDPAGYLDMGYWRIKSRNKTTFLVHRIIWSLHFGEIPDGFVIDHIDMNKSNNKISNLRAVTPAINSRNREFVSNGGVTRQYSGRNVPYWQVTWVELDGSKGTKCFSIKILGEEEAYKQAKDFRRVVIERLNEQGANYTLN